MRIDSDSDDNDINEGLRMDYRDKRQALSLSKSSNDHHDEQDELKKI
jgi:hypothetical protein